jgi:tRNA pseudouridine32 synthase/23S rRNA pseudouridine746 synthase
MIQLPPSVPLRGGLAPSCLQLPAGQWPTLLAFLLQRFPHIDEATWRQRLASSQVFDQHGRACPLDSPYQAHSRIWYYREVAHEIPVPFESPVLYRDQRLLVADKPHFLATMPAGRYVHETLLARLRKSLELPFLVPIHRLDRETAGVMLFCIDPDCRGAYQNLFQQQKVQKEYQAIAGFRPELTMPMVHSSRLEERADSFLMCEVEGEVNSETRIELMEQRGTLARYRLQPKSGKKHQLRAHLAALGIGIHADPWYPELLPAKAEDDFSNPLLLLASSIQFIDPIDGTARCYHSARQLKWPQSDVC